VAIEAETARRRDQGRKPYPITVGGADPIGSRGYLDAARELREQVPDVGLVVVADGSGGMHAGLAVGFGSYERVLGISAGAFPDIEARVSRLAVATARSADLAVPSGVPVVSMRFAPAGYGTELDEVRDALRLAARTEGLILDPVYTGKALAALHAGLAEGGVDKEQTIVFVHSGGVYGLLSERYANWAAGPLG
jgi:L-cysteate sulfo-lyase